MGIIEATSKSDNHTSHTSGTIFTASILDGLMQAQYDAGTPEEAMSTKLFVGATMRAKIDLFTQKTNVVVNNPQGQQTIVRTVSTYETAFGTLNVHKHRYVQQSGDATGRVLALNPEFLKIAWLEMPFIDTGLARSGDYDVRAVVGKGTLETRNQNSVFYADGFIKTG